MKNRDLDNIYREGFKDQEMTPPDGMWERIAARLPEEKPEPAAYPIWFPLVGAAAILLLFFNISLLFYQHQTEVPNSPVVGEQEFLKTPDEADSHNVPITTEKFNQTINAIVTDFENRLQEANNSIDSLKQITKSQRALKTRNNHSGVASTGHQEQGGSENSSTAEKTSENSTFATTNQTGEESGMSGIVQSVPDKSEGQEDAPPAPSVERKPEENPVPMPGKSLEEQLAFDDREAPGEQEEKTESRFSVSTKVAPIFFETGGGNIFDQQFSRNKASGEVSFAYGVNIAYKLSDRIKLRSGLNKVEVGYQTQEVPYNSAVQSKTLDASPKATMMSSPAPGVLDQQLGFFELPLEMEYLLVDKKIGLSVLVGGSSLFLDENNVSLNSSVFSADLGEANNLNKTSFTTNLGLGINYNLTSQFKFNLEPIIKYQLNTFKNTDVNPYFFGVYTGFSIDF